MLETETRIDPSTSGSGGNVAAGPPNLNGVQSSTSQVNLVAYLPRPAYRFKPQITVTANDVEGYGRRLRKNLAQVRRHIDCVASVLNYIENRCWQDKTPKDRPFIQPHILYSSDTYPPVYSPDKPIDCVTSKFVRSAMNKVKSPIYDICWTPEGRRLITGASSGEFTLWNGTAFNFETILQAHDSAVRAMKWSHNDSWLVTADHDGFIKYWQANMNNVTMFQAHKEAVRSLSFCPSDVKFTTASDDGTVRVWDFIRCYEERILRGHGSDVRCVDWHPSKALLLSGSRDSQQPVKLWDPKSGQCLTTLHDHKNAVMAVQWNANGNWFISASRDHLIKLYDIRMMKEMTTFRGHKKEVSAISWHPVHEGLFVSGGADGSMMFWLVGNEREVGLMETAHEQTIWTLKWHPLGHILASGSNDNNTKFWTRNKPGDLLEDFYGMVSNNPYDQSSTVAPSAAGPVSRSHLSHEESGSSSIGTAPFDASSPIKRGSSGSFPSFSDRQHSSSGNTPWSKQYNQLTGGLTSGQHEEGAPATGGGGAAVSKQQSHGSTVSLASSTSAASASSAASQQIDSIPGLGGVDGGDFPGLGGGASAPQTSFGARKTLLKQPPPKKAQRQFERVWNVSSQFVPDYEEAPMSAEPDYARKVKPSLLGAAPPIDATPPQRQPPPPPPAPSGGSGADWSSLQRSSFDKKPQPSAAPPPPPPSLLDMADIPLDMGPSSNAWDSLPPPAAPGGPQQQQLAPRQPPPPQDQYKGQKQHHQPPPPPPFFSDWRGDIDLRHPPQQPPPFGAQMQAPPQRLDHQWGGSAAPPPPPPPMHFPPQYGGLNPPISANSSGSSGQGFNPRDPRNKQRGGGSAASDAPLSSAPSLSSSASTGAIPSLMSGLSSLDSSYSGNISAASMGAGGLPSRDPRAARYQSSSAQQQQQNQSQSSLSTSGPDHVFNKDDFGAPSTGGGLGGPQISSSTTGGGVGGPGSGSVSSFAGVDAATLEMMMMSGAAGGLSSASGPPNPKRKWKQEYEAEEKMWGGAGSSSEMDGGPRGGDEGSGSGAPRSSSGDVDERILMSRGGGNGGAGGRHQRRRYN